MKVAGAVDACVLKTGHFYDFEIGLANAQVKLGFNLKAWTVNIEEIKAVFPEGVHTAEHISEVRPEKQVSN